MCVCVFLSMSVYLCVFRCVCLCVCVCVCVFVWVLKVACKHCMLCVREQIWVVPLVYECVGSDLYTAETTNSTTRAITFYSCACRCVSVCVPCSSASVPISPGKWDY